MILIANCIILVKTSPCTLKLSITEEGTLREEIFSQDATESSNGELKI